MNAGRFDGITKRFASSRVSRRRVITQGGTGLASGALGAAGLAGAALAQDATPATSTASPDDGPTMLFVQAFQSGTVAPKQGESGRYILTLEQGLGHTVYFSDRPDRIVGSLLTPQFLAQLGFDVPPNATLVVETARGQTEVMVLELFSPSYDVDTHTAIYEVAVLAEFEREANGFAETDEDLAELLPQFGAAHLFIDALSCLHKLRVPCHPIHEALDWTGEGQCCQVGEGSNLSWSTCGVSGFDAAEWSDTCNATYPECGDTCEAAGVVCQTIC
jgi:hypothetical protein